MAERKTPIRGRYYEDFELGARYRHHWGRTLTEGEASLFATWTMNANPLYFNRVYAQSLGHPTTPVSPLFAMNVVFGLSVEDLSEQALAHLGYWAMVFREPVYPGDTLFSESEVLGKRPSESKADRGIVHVRTRGLNQAGRTVLEYERKILVKKREAFGGGPA
ncbi:MAG: MaoC family dehydratase [Myxococcales bacterium]